MCRQETWRAAALAIIADDTDQEQASGAPDLQQGTRKQAEGANGGEAEGDESTTTSQAVNEQKHIS